MDLPWLGPQFRVCTAQCRDVETEGGERVGARVGAGVRAHFPCYSRDEVLRIAVVVNGWQTGVREEIISGGYVRREALSWCALLPLDSWFSYMRHAASVAHAFLRCFHAMTRRLPCLSHGRPTLQP